MGKPTKWRMRQDVIGSESSFHGGRTVRHEPDGSNNVKNTNDREWGGGGISTLLGFTFCSQTTSWKTLVTSLSSREATHGE
jgi:hypothetical protein